MEIKYSLNNDILNITASGDFTAYNNEKKTSKLFEFIEKSNFDKIVFDTSNLLKWDSSFLVIIYNIKKTIMEKSKNQNNEIIFDEDGLPEGVRRLIKLSFADNRKVPSQKVSKNEYFIEDVGDFVLSIYCNVKNGFSFFIKSKKSLFKFFSGQAVMRKIDFLFAFEDAGYKALPIVFLISFMVGLILAFVGSMQLKMFSAEVYVASLVAIGMIRIMGPVMAGIIMAGRTGASYAATIGTMQVNEEIDALKTMGIPIIDFLVLPRLLSMTILMPLLTMFADIMGILGGASVGVLLLDIPIEEYYRLTISAITLKNFLIGIFHGYVYGWIIALCGTYYGVNCGKDADSVGKATTMAVVSSIVWIVVATGIITFFFEIFGV